MNSRERILAAINHLPVDRVPTDIWATPEVSNKLLAIYKDHETMRKELHIDGLAGAGGKYIGPELPKVAENEHIDQWGIVYRGINYGSGDYSEQTEAPLKYAVTIDDLEKYPFWQKAEYYDYDCMIDHLKSARETQATTAGYMAIFYFHNLLRGLEQSLIDPYDDPDFTHHLLNKISDCFYDYHRKMFETWDGLIDITQVTDDYGSQHGTIISLDIFREFYKPHVKRFIDLAKEFNIKVFHHDDGAMRPFLPDLVELGIDILNPVQHNCPGMEIEGLKADFGKKICFHGGIDNQSVLPFGTPDEVRKEVRDCIDALASDHTGYILAPCHNIQPVSPVENILAMYDEAYNYGKF